MVVVSFAVGFSTFLVMYVLYIATQARRSSASLRQSRALLCAHTALVRTSVSVAAAADPI